MSATPAVMAAAAAAGAVEILGAHLLAPAPTRGGLRSAACNAVGMGAMSAMGMRAAWLSWRGEQRAAVAFGFAVWALDIVLWTLWACQALALPPFIVESIVAPHPLKQVLSKLGPAIFMSVHAVRTALLGAQLLERVEGGLCAVKRQSSAVAASKPAAGLAGVIHCGHGRPHRGPTASHATRADAAQSFGKEVLPWWALAVLLQVHTVAQWVATRAYFTTGPVASWATLQTFAFAVPLLLHSAPGAQLTRSLQRRRRPAASGQPAPPPGAPLLSPAAKPHAHPSALGDAGDAPSKPQHIAAEAEQHTPGSPGTLPDAMPARGARDQPSAPVVPAKAEPGRSLLDLSHPAGVWAAGQQQQEQQQRLLVHRPGEDEPLWGGAPPRPRATLPAHMAHAARGPLSDGDAAGSAAASSSAAAAVALPLSGTTVRTGGGGGSGAPRTSSSGGSGAGEPPQLWHASTSSGLNSSCAVVAAAGLSPASLAAAAPLAPPPPVATHRSAPAAASRAAAQQQQQQQRRKQGEYVSPLGTRRLVSIKIATHHHPEHLVDGAADRLARRLEELLSGGNGGGGTVVLSAAVRRGCVLVSLEVARLPPAPDGGLAQDGAAAPPWALMGGGTHRTDHSAVSSTSDSSLLSAPCWAAATASTAGGGAPPAAGGAGAASALDGAAQALALARQLLPTLLQQLLREDAPALCDADAGGGGGDVACAASSCGTGGGKGRAASAPPLLGPGQSLSLQLGEHVVEAHLEKATGEWVFSVSDAADAGDGDVGLEARGCAVDTAAAEEEEDGREWHPCCMGYPDTGCCPTPGERRRAAARRRVLRRLHRLRLALPVASPSPPPGQELPPPPPREGHHAVAVEVRVLGLAEVAGGGGEGAAALSGLLASMQGSDPNHAASDSSDGASDGTPAPALQLWAHVQGTYVPVTHVAHAASPSLAGCGGDEDAAVVRAVVWLPAAALARHHLPDGPVAALQQVTLELWAQQPAPAGPAEAAAAAARAPRLLSRAPLLLDMTAAAFARPPVRAAACFGHWGAGAAPRDAGVVAAELRDAAAAAAAALGDGEEVETLAAFGEDLAVWLELAQGLAPRTCCDVAGAPGASGARGSLDALPRIVRRRPPNAARRCRCCFVAQGCSRRRRWTCPRAARCTPRCCALRSRAAGAARRRCCAHRSPWCCARPTAPPPPPPPTATTAWPPRCGGARRVAARWPAPRCAPPAAARRCRRRPAPPATTSTTTASGACCGSPPRRRAWPWAALASRCPSPRRCRLGAATPFSRRSPSTRTPATARCRCQPPATRQGRRGSAGGRCGCCWCCSSAPRTWPAPPRCGCTARRAWWSR